MDIMKIIDIKKKHETPFKLITVKATGVTFRDSLLICANKNIN